jgi:hypothetical protein
MRVFKRLFILTSGLVVFALVACGDTPPSTGAPRDFASACDLANDRLRVRVDGYLRLPDSFSGVRGAVNDVVLELYQASDFNGRGIGVLTEFGTQSNQLEKVAARYSDTDLKVHLSDGQVALYGTKVRISGKVTFPDYVGWNQNLLCRLDNPLIDPAG